MVPEKLTVCARVFGNKFAEMPFVATKEGYRREGNCKRLLKVCSAQSCHMTDLYMSDQ